MECGKRPSYLFFFSSFGKFSFARCFADCKDTLKERQLVAIRSIRQCRERQKERERAGLIIEQSEYDASAGQRIIKEWIGEPGTLTNVRRNFSFWFPWSQVNCFSVKHANVINFDAIKRSSRETGRERQGEGFVFISTKIKQVTSYFISCTTYFLGENTNETTHGSDHIAKNVGPRTR